MRFPSGLLTECDLYPSALSLFGFPLAPFLYFVGVNTALQAAAGLCPYPSWTPVRHMYRPQLFSDRLGSELHSFPTFFQVCVGWVGSFMLVLANGCSCPRACFSRTCGNRFGFWCNRLVFKILSSLAAAKQKKPVLKTG